MHSCMHSFIHSLIRKGLNKYWGPSARVRVRFSTRCPTNERIAAMNHSEGSIWEVQDTIGCCLVKFLWDLKRLYGASGGCSECSEELCFELTERISHIYFVSFLWLDQSPARFRIRGVYSQRVLGTVMGDTSLNQNSNS